MLSQDKDTRVVRVPVGLPVDADGQQNGDRRTDLANHGVVVLAAAAAPVWPCRGAATWSPTPRRIARRSRNENEQRIRRAASSVGNAAPSAQAASKSFAPAFSRSASQRSLSGDLASSKPVGSPRQVPAGGGPYALTSSAPCPHRRSALRADRPTGPRCVIGGRRRTGTTAENHPVVWLDDHRQHI